MDNIGILPNFLIVGAAKSGTTLLYYLLMQHSNIFMPKLKEPHFLSLGTLSKKAGKGRYSIGIYIKEYDEYIKLFQENREKKIIGEASISYLEFPDVTIRNIYKYLPKKEDTKIIIILRNPIERAFSHYLMKKRDGLEHLSFWEAIQKETIIKRLDEGYDFTWDYISLGLYSSKVEKYLSSFKHVKILTYEEFIKNIKEGIRDVVSFLGGDITNFEPEIKTRYNPSGVSKNGFLYRQMHKLIFHQNLVKEIFKKITSYRTRMYLKSVFGNWILSKPNINNNSKRFLYEIYKDDIRRLEKLIGKSLEEWKV